MAGTVIYYGKCGNQETKMSQTKARPYVDKSRCTLCGACVEVCPCHAIKLEEDGPVFDCPQDCDHHCRHSKYTGFICLGEELCPHKAISWEFDIVFEDGVEETRNR
jgi:ferredoxin